jgi:tetratricopeptide (TPR) repeat protein
MAQKKVNKNLVGGMTAVGMVVLVTVAAVATLNAAQRDPVKIAQRAVEAEKAGNPKRAMQLYGSAFKVNKEAKYLVAGSAVAYGMGDLGDALQWLRQAHSQEPENADILHSILERYWELALYGYQQPAEVSEFSEKLLRLKPGDLLGLICLSQALTSQAEQDPTLAPRAQEALKQAEEIAPNDWRLALAKVTLVMREGLDAARALMRGGNAAAAQARLKAAREATATILKGSIATNRDQPRLITELARVQRDLGEREESIKVLERGIVDLPKSAEVRMALARDLTADLAAGTPDVASVDRVLALVKEVIQVEPAMYEAYGLYARLKQKKAELDGRWDSARLEAQRDVLDTFVAAQEATLKLRSLRAVIGESGRAQMIAAGFELALGLAIAPAGTATEAHKDALKFARRFREDMASQYSQAVFVPMMDGNLAVLEEDLPRAIKAFTEAEQRASSTSPFFSKQCKEQLAILYTRTNTPGLALKYTDEALNLYAQLGQQPSMAFLLNRGNLLVALDRAKEALDLVDSLPAAADDRDRRALRAKALALLGRAPEAERILAENTKVTESDAALLDEARLALFQDDAGTAYAKLRAALEKNPKNLVALRLFAQVANSGGKQTDGAAFLREAAAKVSEPEIRAAYETFSVVLGAKDDAERDARLIEMIEKIADPCDRVAEFYNFYSGKQDWEKCQTYADELEKCRPDSNDTLQVQFALALRRKQFDRAEQYMVKLAKANADNANGNVYRGQIKLAREDYEGALADFRAAERELPTDVEMKVRVAEVLLRCNPPRVEEAVTVLKTAVEYNPRHFAANRLLYACYERLGRREDGIEYLERAAAINRADEFIRDRLRVLEETKDPAKGVQFREARRAESPDDADNLVRLVELYEKIGTDEALAKAEAVLTESTRLKNAVLWIAGAKYFAKRGKRAEGEEFLRSAIASAEGGSKLDAQLMLGRFYEQVGDPAAAQTVFTAAQKQVDEIVGSDKKLLQRGRVAIAIAMAEFFDRNRQPTQMIEAYKTALESLLPEELATIQDVRLKIIKGYLNEQQYAEAEKQVDAYAKDYPKDVRAKMARAELILRRNPDEKALGEATAILNSVLQEQPDNVFCLYMRGKISAALNREAEARADLLRCKSLQPKAFAYEPRLDLVRLYERRRENALAEAELREICAEQPAAPQFAQMLLNFLTRTDQADKAIKEAGELMVRFPKEPFWPYQQGLIFMSRDEYSAAVSVLDAAMKLSKGEPSPQIAEAYIRALVKAERFREVGAAVTALRNESITPRIRASLAEALIKLGQRPKAIEQIEQGIRESTARNADEVALIAETAMGLIGEADTVACLRRVIEALGTDRTVARTKTALARILALSSEPAKREEGVQLADDVLKAAPPGSQVAVAAYIVKALALDASNDFDGAQKAYEAALRIAPNDVTVLNNLAYVLADRRGKPEEAVRYAVFAAQLAPTNANVLDTLGWIQAKIGQLDAAEANLQDAIRQDPEAFASMEHLAQVYVMKKQNPDARKVFERLLEKARKAGNAALAEKAQQELNKLK